MGFSKKILKSASVMMFFTLLSKITGQVRQMLALAIFGRTPIHDAYVSANRIPFNLRELLAEGALSAAFVPIFSKILVEKDKKAAFHFANNIINITVLFNLILITVFYFFTYDFMSFYHDNPAYQNLAAELLQTFLPYIAIISFNAILMGILNSLDIYSTPSLSPLMGNLVFIVCLLLTYKTLHVYSLVWSMLASGVAYVLTQVPSIIKSGFRYRFVIDLKDKYVREFLILFFPAALSMGIPKLMSVISNIFSTSFDGGNTSLYYSFIVLQLPISVFITGISVISLTKLSQLFELKKMDEYKAFLINGLRFILFFALPCFVGLLVLSFPIIKFIYYDFFDVFVGKINLTLDDLQMISDCLFYYSLGIIPMSLTVIYFRVFQSMRKINVILISSGITVIVFFVSAFFLIKTGLTFSGIALASSISSFANLFMLVYLAKKQIGKLYYAEFFVSVAKMFLSATLMGWSIIILEKIGLNKIMINMIYVPIILIIGMIIYFGLLYLLKESEFIILYGKIKDKLFEIVFRKKR